LARQAYRSLYGDLTKLKDTSLLNLTGTGDDPELFELLLDISAWVDRYTDRHFYPRVQILEFDGSGTPTILVPDLIAVTTVKQDEGNAGTFEVTWAATDYRLNPYNSEATEHWGEPYTRLEVRKGGPRTDFALGESNFEIAGRWGYREFKEDSGSNIADAGGINATDTTVGVTLGTDFAIGHTILIESEQMLVTNIAANILTVRRALNGTTGATHADTTDVFILRWPSPIERATLINAARLWTRAPDFEPFYVDQDIDTDVRELLSSYRRLTV